MFEKTALEKAKAALAKGTKQHEAAKTELAKAREAMNALEVEINEIDPTDAMAIDKVIDKQEALKRRVSIFNAQVDAASAEVTRAQAALVKAQADELREARETAIDELRKGEANFEATVTAAQMSVKAGAMGLRGKLEAARQAEQALAAAEGRSANLPSTEWLTVINGHVDQAGPTLERVRYQRKLGEEAATQAGARA